MNGEHTDKMLDLIKDQNISYLDAIEDELSGNNLYASILHYICFEDGAAGDAIKKALHNREKDREKFLKALDDIDNKFQRTISKDIDKLIVSLKEKSLSIFETMDNDKEVNNEQD